MTLLSFYKRSSPNSLHHDRILLALAYLDGARDNQPMAGAMIRLMLASLVSEYEAELQRLKGNSP